MPSDLLILIEGTLRVQQVSEGGREVVLCRVRPGETCVLTTACLMTEEGYAAEGIAETDLVLAAVPQAAFDGIMAGSAGFRRFVLETYARRLADLFLVIEQIAFRRIDVRLARRLLDRRAAAGPRAHATPQAARRRARHRPGGGLAPARASSPAAAG